MKIAIVSDFHLGYERFYTDAYNQAREALEEAANSADAIIIPGDVFDMRHPKPEVFGLAINLFRDLSRRNWRAKVVEIKGQVKNYTDVPIIVIPGTHERRAANVEDPVGLLGLAGLVVNANNAQAVIECDGERIAVYGIGGIAEERFKDTLNEVNPRPAPGMFNIFMFHQSIYELLPFSDKFIHYDEFPNGFDLYVGGHIHNRIEGKIHNKPFLIPGSTVLTQLKDGEQEEKGFYVYDTKNYTYTFHRIKSRKFVSCEVNVENKELNDIMSDLTKQVAKIFLLNKDDAPVIRVMLKGKLKPGVKGVDIGTRSIIRDYSGKAIVEIDKSKMHDGEVLSDIEALRQGMLKDMSIKDYGLSIFMEKLTKGKYGLEISPSELFEILSADENKEKSIKKALDKLFQDQGQ